MADPALRRTPAVAGTAASWALDGSLAFAGGAACGGGGLLTARLVGASSRLSPWLLAVAIGLPLVFGLLTGPVLGLGSWALARSLAGRSPLLVIGAGPLVCGVFGVLVAWLGAFVDPHGLSSDEVDVAAAVGVLCGSPPWIAYVSVRLAGRRARAVVLGAIPWLAASLPTVYFAVWQLSSWRRQLP